MRTCRSAARPGGGPVAFEAHEELAEQVGERTLCSSGVSPAGRYPDGSVSDEWTDVMCCADQTFVAYLGRCSCGWRGPDRPATGSGAVRCRQDAVGHQVGTGTPFAVAAPTTPPAGLSRLAEGL